MSSTFPYLSYKKKKKQFQVCLSVCVEAWWSTGFTKPQSHSFTTQSQTSWELFMETEGADVCKCNLFSIPEAYHEIFVCLYIWSSWAFFSLHIRCPTSSSTCFRFPKTTANVLLHSPIKMISSPSGGSIQSFTLRLSCDHLVWTSVTASCYISCFRGQAQKSHWAKIDEVFTYWPQSCIFNSGGLVKAGIEATSQQSRDILPQILKCLKLLVFLCQ